MLPGVGRLLLPPGVAEGLEELLDELLEGLPLTPGRRPLPETWRLLLLLLDEEPLLGRTAERLLLEELLLLGLAELLPELLTGEAGRTAERLLLAGVPALGVWRCALLADELWVDVWFRLLETGVRASTVAAMATISATAAAKVKILAFIASSF